MKTRLLFLVLLTSVVVLTFAVASPAFAADSGLPQVGTPDVAHVNPFRGSW
jgi:hypothetical protein